MASLTGWEQHQRVKRIQSRRISYLSKMYVASSITFEVSTADWACDMLAALNLVNQVAFLIIKVLVTSRAVIVLRSVFFVLDDLLFCGKESLASFERAFDATCDLH